MRAVRVCSIGLALCMVATAFAQTKWHVAKTWPVGGEGGWDYVTVDAASHRVFVTRGDHAQAIDENTGKVLGDIGGMVRSHGVALAPEVNRGFITDGGGTGAIVVFDLKTYAVLGKLPAMPDADGIIYDAAMHEVLAVSGDGNALLTYKADIDLKYGKAEAPIALSGSPEFLASDGSKAYINIPDKNVVAVVDLKTRKVVAQWPVAPGGSPTGMAIDRENHRLFVGCRKPQMMIVMSSLDGKVLAALPIGAGVDATRFGNGQGFASTRDGNLTVVGEHKGKFVVEQTVKTAVGSRTLGIDVAAGKIFLPSAEFDGPAAPGKRPKMKPGSFKMLVVDATK